MKKIIYLLFLLSPQIFAKKAMVIVLEAPIFKETSVESKIVQYARKGSLVYIDNRDLYDDPTAFSKKVIKFKEGSIKIPSSGSQRWYTTLDRNGQTAYILGRHIKVIYNDFREFNEEVSLEGHDPTDYRLAEPLPDNYPFVDGKEFRFNLTIGVGPGQKSNYNYNAPISREDYRIRNGFALNILWPEDLFNHFRIGVNAGFYKQMRRFYLDEGNRSANETGGSLSVGPTINYDQFKGKRFQITYSAGLNFNWARFFVQQESLNAMEERLFSGIYFTPKVYSTFSWQRLFFDSVDLLVQLEGIFDYPHSYTSKTEPALRPFWTPESDKISVPGGATFLVYLGIQAKI